MRKLMIAATAGSLLAGTAVAAEGSADEIATLRQQVQALLQRVEQLEAAAAAQATPPAAMKRQVAEIQQVNDAQTDQLASALAAVRDADWARKLRWKGDLRYRHEQFDIEGTTSDRVRHRIRARFGFDAKISDTLTAGLQLATGEISDPRSSNATLDDASRRKDVALDLAFISWKAFDGGVVTVGKQKQPWFKAGNSLFWDGDVNPEGVALSWSGKGGGFVNAWGFWLEESSSRADSNLLGAQAGYAFGGGLRLAAGYWDYGAVQRQPVLNFADAPAGNSTFSAGSNCLGAGTTRCYLHDYNIVVLDAEWAGKVGSLPLALFAGWLKNLDADSLDTGYNAGFLLGKASAPGSWEFGALYQDVEKDAQFGALLDSDFAGGLTQGRGVQLQGAWAPVRNMTVKATMFLNERLYDTASEVDYKRLQLDLNYRF